MSETVMRHIVATAAFLLAGAIYASGYFSGLNGWWWTALSLVAFYAIVFKLVKA